MYPVQPLRAAVPLVQGKSYCSKTCQKHREQSPAKSKIATSQWGPGRELYIFVFGPMEFMLLELKEKLFSQQSEAGLGTCWL